MVLARTSVQIRTRHSNGQDQKQRTLFIKSACVTRTIKTGPAKLGPDSLGTNRLQAMIELLKLAERGPALHICTRELVASMAEHMGVKNPRQTLLTGSIRDCCGELNGTGLVTVAKRGKRSKTRARGRKPSARVRSGEKMSDVRTRKRSNKSV